MYFGHLPRNQGDGTSAWQPSLFCPDEMDTRLILVLQGSCSLKVKK